MRLKQQNLALHIGVEKIDVIFFKMRDAGNIKITDD